MTLQKYLCSLLILLYAGCSPMPQPVGGSCEYETIIGVARLHPKNGALFASFSSKYLRDDSVTSVQFEIDRQRLISARLEHPAKLKRIISGSCTPYSLTLLGLDNGQHDNIFIQLDKDGNLLTQAKQMVQQIGETYTRLQNEALTLHLCGQTHHTGSDEYNSNLGMRHTKLVAKVLQEEGVLAEQITMTSMGEYGCTPTCSTLHDNTNGVCISFRIPDYDEQH